LSRRYPQYMAENRQLSIMKKIIIIVCFLIYGIILGFASIWYDRHGDTGLYLNIPGYLLGTVFESGWTRFIGGIRPWVMRMPQVYVLSSALSWGLLGTFFVVFLKPKIIAWIVGVYLVIFGTLTILVELF